MVSCLVSVRCLGQDTIFLSTCSSPFSFNALGILPYGLFSYNPYPLHSPCSIALFPPHFIPSPPSPSLSSSTHLTEKRKNQLTFVFFILHLSHAFHTLLCLPSSSGLLVPDTCAALFAPLGPGFEIFPRFDGALLDVVVASLSVEGGEGSDGGCDGGIVMYMC